MNVLDLFSGIGGFSLGFEAAGFRTIAFCEIEPYCQAVLRKHWPDVPIHSDITKLDGKQFAGTVDVVCGGFPCQDLSTAGRMVGIRGERSGLWSELHRIISEIRPKYAIVENVPNLLAGERGAWFSQVLGDLAEIGYDAEWDCIPASRVGANHIRDRVWIICYPNSKKNRCKTKQKILTKEALPRRDSGFFRREMQPRISGMDDGIPNRMDRLACLGNAVVPQIPYLIGKAIMQCEGG